MIKRLLAHSFIQILDEQLKYVADESNKYFKYNNWKERGSTSLTSLKLGNLKKLDLSFLGLKTLPYEIGYFQNLEELNLAGNSLRELLDEIYMLAPGTFVQLAGVNPYSQPKSIRTLSRRSFVQNDILPAGRKSAGN